MQIEFNPKDLKSAGTRRATQKKHEKWVNLSHIKMVNESDERGTPKYGKMAGLEWDQNP